MGDTVKKHFEKPVMIFAWGCTIIGICFIAIPVTCYEIGSAIKYQYNKDFKQA